VASDIHSHDDSDKWRRFVDFADHPVHVHDPSRPIYPENEGRVKNTAEILPGGGETLDEEILVFCKDASDEIV